MNMLCYTAKGNKVADEIKVANKLTLRWQDDPGLAGWTQPNHRSPYKWKSEAEKENQRDGNMKRKWFNVAGFEDGRVGP